MRGEDRRDELFSFVLFFFPRAERLGADTPLQLLTAARAGGTCGAED